MTRSKPYSGATLLAFLVTMVAMVTLVACRETPVPSRPLDLRTVAPCVQEDGSGPGQTYPCVFDAMERNSEPYTGTRWTLYIESVCPVITLQDETGGVTCVDMRSRRGEE